MDQYICFKYDLQIQAFYVANIQVKTEYKVILSNLGHFLSDNVEIIYFNMF